MHGEVAHATGREGGADRTESQTGEGIGALAASAGGIATCGIGASRCGWQHLGVSPTTGAAAPGALGEDFVRTRDVCQRQKAGETELRANDAGGAHKMEAMRMWDCTMVIKVPA